MASLDPKLSSLFSDLESQHGLPSGLLKAVAQTESAFNPRARSPVGAAGMFQFMPATAKQYGVDVDDPVSSAQGAARMYQDLLKQNGGDLNRALAGYNWGQGNLNKKGLGNAPAETRGYIKKVNALLGGQSQIMSDEPRRTMTQQQPQLKREELGGIPPEVLEAYTAYRAQLQEQQMAQEAAAMPQQQAEPEIAPEVLEAYQAYKAQQAAPQAPAQAPAAPVAQAAPMDEGKDAFDRLVIAGEKGEDLGRFWNSLTPRQQAAAKPLIRGAYQKLGVPESTFSRVLEGANVALGRTADAFEQIGVRLNPFASKEDVAAKDQYVADRQGKRELLEVMNPSRVRGAAEVGTEVLGAVVGGAATGAGKVAAGRAPGMIVKGAGLPARAADLGAQSAVASVLQNPVVNAANPAETEFLKGKATQAAVGATIGAVGGVAAEKVVSAAANKLAQRAAVKNFQYSPEDLAFIARQDAAGIRWAPSDLPSAGSALKKRAETATQNDKKLGEFVEGQQKELTRRVDDIRASVSAPNAQRIMTETGLDQVAANSRHAFNASTKELEQRIANVAPDNPNEILKLSAEAQYLSNRARSRDLYDEVESLVPAGTDVPVLKAMNVANEARREVERMGAGSQRGLIASVADDMEGVLKKIQEGNSSYADINFHQRAIADAAQAAKKAGNANGARMLNDFKRALDKDKEEYMSSLPFTADIKKYQEAYKRATDYNRESVQSIKKNKMSALFDEENLRGNPNWSDNLIEKMVKSGETQKIKQIFDALPETGKEAVRQGVINKIYNEGLGADGLVSPTKLLKAYKAYEDKSSGQTPLSVVLPVDAKRAFDDLMKNMPHLTNIGRQRANPQTGAQNRQILEGVERSVAAGAAVGAKTGSVSLSGLAVAVAPIVNFIKNRQFVKGMTDPKVKKMITAMSSANPASPVYADRAAKLGAYLASTYPEVGEQD